MKQTDWNKGKLFVGMLQCHSFEPGINHTEQCTVVHIRL